MFESRSHAIKKIAILKRLIDSRRSRLLFDMNDDENSFALVASTTSKLRFEDVNFFDSNYQEKDKKIVNHLAFASVVNANKHVFYRDVYVFTNKLFDLVKQHDNETIENVIIVCFRDIALMWYSMKIDDFLRNLFRDAKLNIWCTALIDRFRTRSSIALIQLTIQFYFLNEIKQKYNVFVNDFNECFITSKSRNSILFTINSLWFEIAFTIFFDAIYQSRKSSSSCNDFSKISMRKSSYDTKWLIVKQIVKSRIVNNNSSAFLLIVNNTSIVTIIATTSKFSQRRSLMTSLVKSI